MAVRGRLHLGLPEQQAVGRLVGCGPVLLAIGCSSSALPARPLLDRRDRGFLRPPGECGTLTRCTDGLSEHGQSGHFADGWVAAGDNTRCMY